MTRKAKKSQKSTLTRARFSDVATEPLVISPFVMTQIPLATMTRGMIVWTHCSKPSSRPPGAMCSKKGPAERESSHAHRRNHYKALEAREGNDKA
jgi:hypothetical protein